MGINVGEKSSCSERYFGENPVQTQRDNFEEGVGGGSFFLVCEDFGRMFDNSFSA